MTRQAVVLFNLGGPDTLKAVEPFLINLFCDRAIIRLPGPLRWLVAQAIAKRRAPVARAIYEQLGGSSPILANTEAQARALETALGDGTRVFIAMRYWHPLSRETVQEVKDWAPDRIVLVPLYPQFSTTTTASSLAAWRKEAKLSGLAVPTQILCCYPTEPGFVTAIAEGLKAGLTEFPAGSKVRILFSAHGLPERIVAGGDPYLWQVQRTVEAVLTRLGRRDLDTMICFQSRVGPLRWLLPSTEAEIRQAGAERKALIVVPISFVSEHSETLVELDKKYSQLAHTVGVPAYRRLPAVATHAAFIEGLAREICRLRAKGWELESAQGGRQCPRAYGGCLFAEKVS
jgi:ferrochelatase